jgi:leucine dehydrogenase
LFVTDINPANADRVNREFNGIVIAPEEIVSAPVDVLAPCALGGILNFASIPEVQAHIIAGAANNQLSTQDDAMRLHERGILFLPDYVINAGGIIAVAREYLGGSNRDVVEQQVRQIPHRMAQLLQTAERKNIPPLAVADRKVQRILRRSSNRSQASASHSM